MKWIEKILLTIWDIFLEMSPYLLLGLLIAGILHVFVPKKFIEKQLGKKGFLSSLRAAIIGVPLPLCSCGVIPTGISFHKNGAGKGATNSFLISTPQTGVDSILITYSMMNIYWAVARPIIALITGVLGGYATDVFDKKPIPDVKEIESCTDNCETENKDENKIKKLFQYAFDVFLSDISRQLIIGILIAVAITIMIPDDFFENYFHSPIVNMLIVLMASIPLYVCATGSVPIAASLLTLGVSPGAVLVFLMAGPATNAATITVLWKSMGKKSTLIYLISIVSGALFFGILIDYVLPANWFIFQSSNHSAHVHGENRNWIEITSAILFISLLLWVEIKKLIPKKNILMTENIYIVEGMTCNHCKNSVEKNLSIIENVENVEVDLQDKTVHIKGLVNDTEIEKIVNELGYEFKGRK